ncbi:MAG: efflux RND transporter periplasmic adaptor subunit [Pseudomonadota bacterium]
MAQEDRKTEKRGSRLGQAARVVGRTGVTLAVAAGAVFAVQIGASELAQRADAAVSQDVAPVMPVATAPLRQETRYAVTRRYVGQIEPQKTVALSFELSGRLDDIAVDEGAHVAAGQVLARQDTALLRAEQDRLTASRDATEAQLVFAKQTLERSTELTNRGFATQAGLDEALARDIELTARLAEIDAALVDVEIRLGKTEIRAPFAGRITERRVDGGETLVGGQAIIDIVALDAPQVRVGVPLTLSEADLQDVEVEIGGIAQRARLVTLRPDVDPVTRTRTALFEIDRLDTASFGQTAQLVMTEEVAADGFWLPTTSLKEGVRGQWTVLVVDPENVVRAAVVEVLHAESERVYVRAALPEGTRLINQGPQRVTVGQQVAAANAE